MGTPKVMKLICENMSILECRVCGNTHFALIKPQSDGSFYRGSWQCVNGCKYPKNDKLKFKARFRKLKARENKFQKAIEGNIGIGKPPRKALMNYLGDSGTD